MNEPKLRQLKIALGYDCNMECGFCLQLRKDKTDAIDFSAVEKVFNEPMVKQDVETIVLTGGEPTYKPYVETTLKIVKLAKEQGKETCIFTNGHLLDKWMLQDFRDAGLSRFRVSLYDPTDWDEVAALIGRLKSLGFPAFFKYTVTKENITNLMDILFHVKDVGVEWFQIKPYNRVEVPEIDEKYELAPEQVRFLSMVMLEFKKRESQMRVDLLPLCYEFLVDDTLGVDDLSHCNCGQGEKGYLVITPNGDVKICGAYPEPLGNIEHHSMTSLWLSHPLLHLVRNRTEPEECNECGNWDKCSKTDCHSATYAKYGNFDHANPQCPIAKKKMDKKVIKEEDLLYTMEDIIQGEGHNYYPE